eukprot:1395066-Amorphochlora_amoeboformis.AAC.1
MRSVTFCNLSLCHTIHSVTIGVTRYIATEHRNFDIRGQGSAIHCHCGCVKPNRLNRYAHPRNEAIRSHSVCEMLSEQNCGWVRLGGGGRVGKP